MNTLMSFTTTPPKRSVSTFHRAYGFGIPWSEHVAFDPGVMLTDLEANELADESLELVEDLAKMAANHFQSSIGYTLYEPLATPSLAAFQHGWEFQRFFAIDSEKQQAQVRELADLYNALMKCSVHVNKSTQRADPAAELIRQRTAVKALYGGIHGQLKRTALDLTVQQRNLWEAIDQLILVKSPRVPS
jgi:hypothetical protein